MNVEYNYIMLNDNTLVFTLHQDDGHTTINSLLLKKSDLQEGRVCQLLTYMYFLLLLLLLKKKNEKTKKKMKSRNLTDFSTGMHVAQR